MSRRPRSRAPGALFAAVLAATLQLVSSSPATAAEPAAAGPAVVSPDVFVDQQIDALNEILAREKTNQLPALRARFKDVLDFGGFAEGAMGPRWDKITEKQRVGVKDALQELLESRYLVRGSRGPFDRKKIVLGTVAQEGDVARVDGTVKQPEVDVQFVLKLRRFKQSWKIDDVVIDGLSLLDDYRSQFTTFLKKKSVDDLITRLHSRAKGFLATK